MPGSSKRARLAVICENGVRIHHSKPLRRVRCASCHEETAYNEADARCEICGVSLSPALCQSVYSAHEPNLIPVHHDMYQYFRPVVRNADERRHPRIPCRNVKGCIKTEAGRSIVVTLVNVSRGGACFQSSEEFCPGTPVMVATHYIEGSANIFQKARIVRVQHEPTRQTAGEYAIEFIARQP